MEQESETDAAKALALCDLGLKLEKIPGRLSQAEKAYKGGLEAGPEVSFVLASYASFYIRKKLADLIANVELRDEVEKCIIAARNKIEEFETDYASEFLNVCAVFYARVAENMEGQLASKKLNLALLFFLLTESVKLFGVSLETDPQNVDALCRLRVQIFV